MLVREIIGNTRTHTRSSKTTDLLPLEWFETTRRIQRKYTTGGREVALKFTKEGQQLQQDDIVYQDDELAIVVDILPCDAIVIRPRNMAEMAKVCYEIGNKHLPLFLEEEELLIPADEPLFRWLQAAGYPVAKERRKLLHILRTNVQPHAHGSSSPSLFEKILELASK
ncbi:urease accessory protein UreE [Chitinophaga arvensicola]|uniref:Urease accessory protein UreE n=1 Tax=Chitinophaga arvensicola TaxID=29529 RepID=A0A1I0S5T4_9BACT|nr:urease accessory protein UreE [Chitinophaga arvensicola]SEW50520.1 urease accessory protein [Chitinophaga arvensicola]